MANDYFRFKQFEIKQGKSAFKVTTDSVLLGAWADLAGANYILDIGTGTGLLALMAAQRSNAFITAIEPDEESFCQAEVNFSASKWNERIKAVNCSIQQFAETCACRFDAVISNPPYFIKSLRNPDPRKAMARHTSALSQEDMLFYADKLLADAGLFHVILPSPENAMFIKKAEHYGLWCQKLLNIIPVPGQETKRTLMSFGRKKITTDESSLVIETRGRHNYSEEYISLTRDFYLDKNKI